MNAWFSLPFLFARSVDSAVAGLEEAKNLAGKGSPPDSDPLSVRSFYRTRPDLSSQARPNVYIGYRLAIGYRLRDGCFNDSLRPFATRPRPLLAVR